MNPFKKLFIACIAANIIFAAAAGIAMYNPYNYTNEITAYIWLAGTLALIAMAGKIRAEWKRTEKEKKAGAATGVVIHAR